MTTSHEFQKISNGGALLGVESGSLKTLAEALKRSPDSFLLAKITKEEKPKVLARMAINNPLNGGSCPEYDPCETDDPCPSDSGSCRKDDDS